MRRDALRRRPARRAAERAGDARAGVRAELVNRLAAAGLPRVEAVSFVRDDRVPQMAGAEEVVAGIERRDGVEYSGLVLNERGWERFAASGLDRVNVTFAATESFNRANGNASLEEAVARAEAILARAGRRAGDGDDLRLLRLSVRRPRRPGRRRRARGALRGPRGGRARGHDRRRDAVGGARARRADAAQPASTGTTRATPATRTASPRSRRARACSTRRSAASAAARMRRGRPATSRRRISSISSKAKASTRASTSTR